MARTLLALLLLATATPAWAHTDPGIHGRVYERLFVNQSPRVSAIEVKNALINRRSEAVKFFCILQVIDRWRFHGDPLLGQQSHPRRFSTRYTVGARSPIPAHTTGVSQKLTYKVRHERFARIYQAAPLQWEAEGMEIKFQHCHDQ